MPTLGEIRTLWASKAAVAMDRDDPSIGEVKFLTEEGWLGFRLSRGDLKLLAEDVENGLRATAPDLPEG